MTLAVVVVAAGAAVAVAAAALLLARQLDLLREDFTRFSGGTGNDLRTAAAELRQVVEELESLQQRLGEGRARLAHLEEELERAKRPLRAISKYGSLFTVARMLLGGGFSVQGVLAVRNLIKGGNNG